jgi:hypothetical protein
MRGRGPVVFRTGFVKTMRRGGVVHVGNEDCWR